MRSVPPRASIGPAGEADDAFSHEAITITHLATGAPAINNALDEALKPFTAKRSSQPGIHEADVTQAAQVVEQLSRQLKP